MEQLLLKTVHSIVKGFQDYTKGDLELKNSVWLGAFHPDIQKSLFLTGLPLCLDYRTIYEETLLHTPQSTAANSVDKLIEHYLPWLLVVPNKALERRIENG